MKYKYLTTMGSANFSKAIQELLSDYNFESIGKSNFIVGALADAKEGDILGPLPTLRGQAFLRVIDISDVVMSDFEEKKDSIKFSLLIDRQNAIWGNWLQALRDNADLKDYRYDFY